MSSSRVPSLRAVSIRTHAAPGAEPSNVSRMPRFSYPSCVAREQVDGFSSDTSADFEDLMAGNDREEMEAEVRSMIGRSESRASSDWLEYNPREPACARVTSITGHSEDFPQLARPAISGERTSSSATRLSAPGFPYSCVLVEVPPRRE